MPGFRFAVRRGQKSTPMDLMGVLFEAELLSQSSHDLFPEWRTQENGMPGDLGEYI